jgi:hypothetical protein
MPDEPETTREILDRLLEKSNRRLIELGLRSPDPRPDLRVLPTGESDPLLDRLVASVDALAPAGRRRRPKLAVVQGGRDDA